MKLSLGVLAALAGVNGKRDFYKFFEKKGLRVVHTQAILFFKLMSERGGFDIERL